MSRLKYVVSITLVLILLTITSIIKNQARILEMKLSKLNKEINLKEQDINESQLDFYFLTSPTELESKVRALGQNNYMPIKNSNIFLSLSNFTNIQKKISIIKKNEKNTKTN